MPRRCEVPWTKRQVEILEDLIDEAEHLRRNLRLAENQGRLGHTPDQSRYMVSKIREWRKKRTDTSVSISQCQDWVSGKVVRIEWTKAQIDRMKEAIREAEMSGGRVPWSRMTLELGHALHAIRAKAWEVRMQMQREAQEMQHREFMLLAAEIRNGAPLPEPKPVSIDRRTSTTRLPFDLQIGARIREQGLTAGFFGDPAPGRSALDKKRSAERTQA